MNVPANMIAAIGSLLVLILCLGFALGCLLWFILAIVVAFVRDAWGWFWEIGDK